MISPATNAKRSAADATVTSGPVSAEHEALIRDAFDDIALLVGMHHRNLLYTAVTRAKESVIIIGDRWGIDNCASKRQVDRRNTFLSFLLHQETRP